MTVYRALLQRFAERELTAAEFRDAFLDERNADVERSPDAVHELLDNLFWLVTTFDPIEASPSERWQVSEVELRVGVAKVLEELPPTPNL